MASVDAVGAPSDDRYCTKVTPGGNPNQPAGCTSQLVLDAPADPDATPPT